MLLDKGGDPNVRLYTPKADRHPLLQSMLFFLLPHCPLPLLSASFSLLRSLLHDLIIIVGSTPADSEFNSALGGLGHFYGLFYTPLFLAFPSLPQLTSLVQIPLKSNLRVSWHIISHCC